MSSGFIPAAREPLPPSAQQMWAHGSIRGRNLAAKKGVRQQTAQILVGGDVVDEGALALNGLRLLRSAAWR